MTHTLTNLVQISCYGVIIGENKEEAYKTVEADIEGSIKVLKVQSDTPGFASIESMKKGRVVITGYTDDPYDFHVNSIATA